MKLQSLLSINVNRKSPWLSAAIAAAGIAGIAVADWLITPNVSIGGLYVLPILFIAPILTRTQMVGVAALCAVLREVFSPYLGQPGMEVRLLAGFVGFEAVGFFVSELYRSRRSVAQHLSEKEVEAGLRRAAEAEMKVIIETIPLAVLTLNETGQILEANESAYTLLGVSPGTLVGQSVHAFMPVPFEKDGSSRLPVRARMECRARRNDGEPFLAHVWLGPYLAKKNQRTAVVIWDGSDDLRDRQGADFNALMATSRILLGAVSHELRNLVSAARASFAKLEASPGLAGLPDLNRLGRTLASLESAAGTGLRLTTERSLATADLETAMDDTWIIMEPGFRSANIEVAWQAGASLPRVRGDQQGIVQVLINLLQNSHRALENSDQKRVSISAAVEGGSVLLRVRDSGPGVAKPEELFHVFPTGAQTGLGLYLSRSILRSFGGDLRYEPGEPGACFVIELKPVPSGAA